MSNITFADVRRSVNESMSSIFSREDVLRIVDKLEASKEKDFDSSKFEVALNKVLTCILDVEHIDTSDVSDVALSISGMEICVDSVEIHGLDSALDELRYACEDLKALSKSK